MSLKTLLGMTAAVILWWLTSLCMARLKLNGEPPPPGRVFAYVRASTAKQIASPDVQKKTIEDYAQRLGRPIDGFYVDPATTSATDLFDRPAGKKLMTDLRDGDVLIVAKLDRLSRSYIEFARTLELIEKRKVVLHVVDMPMGVFDPSNAISMLLIQILVSFANYERTMIRTRTREALQIKKQNGEKYCRFAPYGWKWHRVWNSRDKKWDWSKVPEPKEIAIMEKAVEMKAQGYSVDEIRQYFNYEWKVYPRPTKHGQVKHWHNNGIQHIIALGCERLAHREPQPRGPEIDDPEYNQQQAQP